MGFDRELLQLRILPLGLALPLHLLDAHAAALASPAAKAMGANVAFLAFALHSNVRVGLTQDKIFCSAARLVFFIDDLPFFDRL